MMDKETIELLGRLFEEQNKKISEIIDTKLGKQSEHITKELKDYIDKNNLVVSEIITTSLEDMTEKQTTIHTQMQEQIEDILHQVGDFHSELQKLVNVTQKNTYEIVNLVEQEKRRA